MQTRTKPWQICKSQNTDILFHFLVFSNISSFFHSKINKDTSVSEEIDESMEVDGDDDEGTDKKNEQKEGKSDDGGEFCSDEKVTSSSSSSSSSSSGTSEDESKDEEENEADL